MKQHNIFKLCFMLLAFIAALPAMGQKMQTYRGTVVDETDSPIIGATVKVAGLASGVITDLDGNFQLEVPAGQQVEISFVGYVTQRISNFKQTKITLKEDSQMLEEVVVVGYGTQKKAHLTGAIATVPVNELQDLSSGNIASMLSGMVTGLSVSGGESRPGEAARVRVRGSGVFDEIGSRSQEPLYVIDGYIYPDEVKVGNTTTNMGAIAFNNLDPSSIESISVLKDASAAVYGARAANGVILVTTKKGKLGAPQISYNGSFGITDEVSRPSMLSAYNYGRLYNTVAAADPRKTTLNRLTQLYQADELEAMKSLNYDLLDKYWKSALTQRHSINITGATEKVNYYGGISYFEQEGNLGKLDYNRWNFRSGMDVKFSQWVKAGLQISGDYGKLDKPNVKVGGTNNEKDYYLLLNHPRYIPEEVNGLPIAAYGISNSSSHNDQHYSHSVLQNSGDYTRNMSSNLNISGNVEYDFGWNKVLKGLKLRLSYSKSISTDKNNQYGSAYKLYTMDIRSGSGKHLYTPVPGTDYDALLTESNFLLANKGAAVSNGDYLSRNMSRSDHYQINFVASYARDFGKHHVGGLFSIERSEAESEYLYGYVSEPYEFTTGQSNSAVGSTKYPVFTRSESGTLSYIGRFNYGYADKYLVEALFRADSSTKFSPSNFWGFFPSVSLGWVVSQEEWFKERFSSIDFFKLRASYGMTGRDNTAPWQWMQIYAQDASKGPVFGSNTASGNRITINKNNSAVNRNIHWDKSYKTNIGFDLNVLNNRLSFNVDAYYDRNREMLLPINQEIPTTVGTQTAAVNFGEIDNYGIEVGITWRDKIGKDFKYKVGINTGYGDNKVLNTDWKTEYIYRQITKNGRADIGTWGMQCIGMFRSFQDIEEYFQQNNITSYMGKSKDEIRPGMLIYKDVRGKQLEDGTYEGPDGIVDKDNDQVRFSHRSNPYGFTTNMSAEWKGVSVTAQMRASWGGYSIIPSDALKPKNGIEATNMPSFWNPDNVFVYNDIYDEAGNLLMSANREAHYPSLAYTDVNSVVSSFWRVSGTRVMLNRVTVAYSLPSKWMKRIGIQSCRLNFTGENLLSLYNPYPDNFIDPMTSYGSYPTLRKFTLGVNVSF